MAERIIKLRAFVIENSDIGKPCSDLLEKLQAKLKSSTSAEDRRMQLNVDDPQKEEDLLSYFSEVSDSAVYQFSTMLRIAPGNEVQHISNGLFGKNRFTLADLDGSVVDAAAIYKSHYYFAVSNNHIVTDLSGNTTILRLQTYLNWLLDSLYEITPVVDVANIPSLAEVRNVVIQDPISQPENGSVDEKRKSVFDLGVMALNAVKEMLVDTTNLKDEELAQVISAKLVVEFSRPKKNSSAELQKIYGALLKPMADVDHVSIRTRQNKTLAKGRDILRVKPVKIDETDSGRINEHTIQQEMYKFLLELENEKKNSS